MQDPNILILIVFALLGYWLVSKFVPAKKIASDNAPQKARSWFEVLDLPEDSDNDQIEARYRELISIYTDEGIAELEPELQAEALACRNEIEHAYHSASFRRSQK